MFYRLKSFVAFFKFFYILVFTLSSLRISVAFLVSSIWLLLQNRTHFQYLVFDCYVVILRIFSFLSLIVTLESRAFLFPRFDCYVGILRIFSFLFSIVTSESHAFSVSCLWLLRCYLTHFLFPLFDFYVQVRVSCVLVFPLWLLR